MITREFKVMVLCIIVFNFCSVFAQDAANSVKTDPEEKLPVIISLDGDWDFAYTPELSLVDKEKNIPALPGSEEFAARMPVPGYWDDELDRMRVAPNAYKFWSSAKFTINRMHEFDFPRKEWPPKEPLRYLEGVGFYRKVIEFPERWSGNEIVLHVGGVRHQAWAWVNGQYLGYYLSGQSFSLDWSFGDKIKPGEKNEIIIAVSNTKKVGGCDTWGDQNFGAGITRSAYLKVSGPSRIESLYAYPRQKNTKLNWEVELDGNFTGATLDWSVEEPLTGKALGVGSTSVNDKSVKWTTDTFRMRPWSDHDPALYNLKVNLIKDGRKLDSVNQRFGLRTIVRDGIGLKLNDRPVILRGALDMYCYPVTKRSPSDVNYHRNVIRNLKEIGFNWIRTHTWVPNEAYLQAADELGMMFQVEQSPGYTPKEWIEIIKYCRKHPSVVLYCYGNEELLDDEMIVFLRERGKELRQYAPDALYNPMEALRGIEYYFHISDMGEDYVRLDWKALSKAAVFNPRRFKEYQSFADVLSSLSWRQLSYKPLAANWRELNHHYKLLGFDRPDLTHEIVMRGGYVDLGLQWRYEGTRTGADPVGYAQAMQKLRDAGLLQKAHKFYVNSSKVTARARKWVLENARKCDYIAGYDYHTLSDCNWNQTLLISGILNEFYELKAGESPEDVLKYNGESVVLIDNTHDRNLYCGETVEYDVMSSLYGSDTLSEGKLIWTLSDSQGYVHQSGDMALNNIPNGSVHKLGKISFTAPDVLKGARLSLRLRIIGGEYDIENDWDHWVFPRRQAPVVSAAADASILGRFGGRYKGFVPLDESSRTSNRLRIVSSLDKDCIDFVRSGSNVVLLGSKPFPTVKCKLLTTWLNSNVPHATAVYDHSVTNDFPHDEYLDWQFYSMYHPSSKGIDFTDTDLPFNPIIEVAYGMTEVRKVSTLFEMRVGLGKLLVCTLNFDLSDPAAVYMLDNIIRYAGSENFKPRTTAKAQDILELLGVDHKAEEAFKVPEAYMPFMQERLKELEKMN